MMYPVPGYGGVWSLSLPQSGTSSGAGSFQGPGMGATANRYEYFLRIINPKKKSAFTVLTWHDATEAFDSPMSLKARLVESFPNDLPDNLDFQVGYLEGRNGTKRWIVEPRDLQRMYSLVETGSKVTLWAEGKSSDDDEPPRKKSKTGSTSTRRELFEEEVDDAFKKLKEKHPDMATPKLRLWARLIQSGRHDDYETPPNIPLITGSPATSKPKKESIGDALTGAATAVVKLLQTQQKDSCSKKPQSQLPTSTYISPMKLAQLRSCLEDLKKIKELLEDGVLTEEEYQEEKQTILNSLKNFK